MFQTELVNTAAVIPTLVKAHVTYTFAAILFFVLSVCFRGSGSKDDRSCIKDCLLPCPGRCLKGQTHRRKQISSCRNEYISDV